MAFHGLFIGIDRYTSEDIDELSCARRDATALHALFSDTLGGDNARLLIDEGATREAIKREFAALEKCNTDDVVMIAFSGHGSETHELVTHDADLRDLPGSCIPLTELTDWFTRIPASRLVFVLDCCFSGGVGAKVLHVESRQRSLESVNSKLEQMSGHGRLILTASSATEPAWENSRHGHGFLTYYLLQALQGAEEVLSGDRISVYRLLEYVTRRVIDAAGEFGEPQHPTIRGTLDGELLWPVFTAGPHYQAAFPEYTAAPVTEQLNSLTEYGFPQPLIDVWAQSIPGLNQLQMDAINHFGVLRGEHLVVSAPTSSGKTMIGELAALLGILERKRALFLLPLRALVNDKYTQFGRLYGPFGVRTIRATGEMSDEIPQLLRGQYDICLMTYEKFTALALANPHILRQVGTVVVDEVQMLADSSRGVNLEFVLTLLRMRRSEGIEPQIVALSAVIGDTNGLENWLGGRLLRRDQRPVPLDEGIIRADGSFRFVRSESGEEHTVSSFIAREFRKNSSQDYIVPLVRRLVSEGKQVIVFRETRGEARGCANYLANSLGLPPATRALSEMPAGDPSLASQALHSALNGGVAFHISDLDREERRVVEEQFRARNSEIRVIVATTTLAMGVNTPAEAVVIAGLMHPGDEPYSVAEYKNIVGRAGRLGFAERGASYLLAISPRDEMDVWPRYVRGEPEDLQSRFLDRSTDPRSLILRVLSAARKIDGAGMTAEAIVEFLESSFGAYQLSRATGGQAWKSAELAQHLASLEMHGLIARGEADTYDLTDLGRLAGEAGVEVRSILRLVTCLRGVDRALLNDPTLIAATQLTVELDQVYFPLNKKSTIKEPQAWFGELRRQQVLPSVEQALNRDCIDDHLPTLRAKKTVACVLWAMGASMEYIEAQLTQFWGRFDGVAGPVRSVASRTVDLLPTVTRVAELLNPGLDLSERSSRLLIRLEVGVAGSLAELASIMGVQLTRGDYHRLQKAGLTTPQSVADADDETIITVLGGDEKKSAWLREGVAAHLAAQERLAMLTEPLPLYQE